MIARMIDTLRGKGAKRVVVRPEEDNAKSNRALEANGFTWDGIDYVLDLEA